MKGITMNRVCTLSFGVLMLVIATPSFSQRPPLTR
jgi:hypothetical protein